MKIAFVVHTAYPEFIGGREHHVHHLANALSANDEVTVFAGGNTKITERCKVDNYTLVRLPMISLKVSRNPLQIYRIIPQLLPILKQERFELVHAFEYGSYSTHIAHIYSKNYGIPFVLTVYGYQLRNPLLRIFKKLYDCFFGRSLLISAKKIFCVSDVQAQEILRIAGAESIKEKVVIQENCISINDYKGVIVKDNWLSKYDLNGKIKLLTIGRLLPRKGILNLVYAFDRVISQYHSEDVKLMIVGPDGGDLKNINNLIKKLKLENSIIIEGAVPYDKVRNFLALSDIFVLPSLYEGLPLSLLEAMALGRAVIFTDLPCAKRVITHGKDGLLVKPGDIDSLVRAILRLSKDKEFREYLGFNAKQTVKRFDSFIEAQKVRKTYEEVVALSAKQ